MAFYCAPRGSLSLHREKGPDVVIANSKPGAHLKDRKKRSKRPATKVKVAGPAPSQKTRGGPASGPTKPPGPLEKAAPWLITLVALGLRLFRLDREPLWFDESYTALSVVKSASAIFELLHGEGNAPLYYLVMRAWTGWFGDSAYALRLVSALFGTAAIPLLFWMGKSMFSRRAGLIAAGLAAVSPLQIHYSQESRMYGMVPLVSLLVLFTLYRLLNAQNWRTFLAFVAAATTGLYLHYYFLFVLPIAGLALLDADRRRLVPIVAAALATVGVAFLPWLPTLLHQQAGYSYQWVPVWWEKHTLGYAVPWSLQALGPGAAYPTWATFKFGSATWAAVMSGCMATFLLGFAATQLLGQRRGGRDEIALPLTFAAVLVPLLIAFGYSLVQRPVYVVGRHDMIAWGAYHLLAGAVLSRLDLRVMLVFIGLWGGIACFTLTPYFTTLRPKRNYADMGDIIAERISAAARPEDMVIFTSSTETMAQYYLRDVAGLPPLVSYPLGSDAHLGWTDPRIRTDEEFAKEEARKFADYMAKSEPLPPVVWLVGPRGRGNPPLLLELQQLGYRQDGQASTRLITRFLHDGSGPES